MTDIETAYIGAAVLDRDGVHHDAALVVHRDGRLSVIAKTALPDGCPTQPLKGGILSPGFVDLQVNGGGGIMFNDAPSIESLHAITQAHRGLGTSALLATLITDTPARTRAAIDAVTRAMAEGMSGLAGLHLEGPHLSCARKGAHDGDLIRTMEDDDLALLLRAADRIPNLMVTVAPETTTNAQITAMAQAGIVVSLGHTDADAKTCQRAFDAGARCVTHLFNAMSPLTSRDPGLVGATLARADIYAGLIADGVHVDPETIKIALAAKPNPERVFLVSDAMATAGSDIDHFHLGGRRIERRDNRLTLADGTLAGAHLDLGRAVEVMKEQAGDDIITALQRAITTPAQLLRDPLGAGQFTRLEEVLYVAEGSQTPARLVP